MRPNEDFIMTSDDRSTRPPAYTTNVKETAKSLDSVSNQSRVPWHESARHRKEHAEQFRVAFI